MQTYSHLLLTAVLRPFIQRRLVLSAAEVDAEAQRESLLAGAVAPDIPLGLLSIGYVLDRRYLRPHLPDKTRCSPTYNDLYFHNPWWIAAHNILHGPLPVLFLGLIGYWGRRQAWGRRLFWFAVGCGLHTAVDIVTHADDGPVITFPLKWQTRFRSPISYWDPAHGGRWFRRLEHVLDVLLVAVLFFRRKEAKMQRGKRG